MPSGIRRIETWTNADGSGMGSGSMASNPRYANGAARRNLRAWLKSQRRPCWICVAFGRNPYIDYELPAGHPMAFEMDELNPVSLGGSPYLRSNVDATHRCCNEWRGNKTVAEVLAIAAKSQAGPTPTSEQW